eukprot:11707326-Prorocentrum_lima.AAC.1
MGKAPGDEEQAETCGGAAGPLCDGVEPRIPRSRIVALKRDLLVAGRLDALQDMNNDELGDFLGWLTGERGQSK